MNNLTSKKINISFIECVVLFFLEFTLGVLC